MTGRPLARIAAAAVILGVAFATLLPQPGEVGEVSLCLLCNEERGLADGLANLLLFLPVGATLALLVGLRRAIALSLLYSLAIEVAQLWVPGRHTALADLLLNTAGGAAGALLLPRLPELLRPRRRVALALAAAWLAGGAAATVGGQALLRPAPTDSAWFGQWTPRLGNFEAYRGRVVDVRLGDLPLPSTALADSDAARATLARGAALTVEAIAGPSPRAAAPIFAVADREERQILMLAADREHIVYRIRTRAIALGLDSPDLRIHDALAQVSPGDTLRIRVAPASGAGRTRIDVNGRAVDAGFSLLDTWALLLWPTFVARAPALHAAMNVIWLLLLIAPPIGWAAIAARSGGRA